MEPHSDQRAIEVFREFLRIKSTSLTGAHDGSYAACVNFLQPLLAEVGFATRVIELVPGKPILISVLPGLDPTLPVVLLNSHYDVVPAVEHSWSCDPWAAVLHENGDIYGRGTQDMKCVVIQHVWALRRLVAAGRRFLRTIAVTCVPDEELGGVEGVGRFVESEHFASLNVGVALDEGLANPTPKMTVFHGERAVWWVKVNATGNAGHGSRFVENSATVKLIACINRFLEFRASQQALYEGKGHYGCQHAVARKLGEVVTLNLTMLRAGVTNDGVNFALNVIPAECSAGFDIRIPPCVPLEEFEDRLKEWTSAEGLSYEFVVKVPEHAVTPLNPSGWWGVFSRACGAINLDLEPEIFPAATDSRYFRRLGIPAFGFSPINNTPILLHDHDERLSSSVFVAGIGIFEHLIAALADAPQKDLS
eukprot:gnl/Spiro4/10120_TR5371_c0_g1_i1.p1 gnl/Spiro4/10120_TR5371_c0_g1~~gnl/Spiro4/10120_TR5371_c0_g1_i1.p1  ORF type:complete len:432 (+),score=96.28 gnl/Spiro4/10120_TR5371_c0_g1_i1:34-1296(+)